MLLLKIYGAILLLLLALALLRLVRVMRTDRKIERAKKAFAPHQQAIESLNFVHSVEFSDIGERIEVDGRQLWADAPIVVVLKSPHNEKRGPVGAIGFYLTTRALEVRQMQGFKGARFHRGTANEFFHARVKDIADALSVSKIRILPATRNRWYKRPYKVPMDQVETFRARLRRLYDETSRKHGYRRQRGWWHKTV